MRHKRRGRHLGRTSSHRKAMLRNLACSLFLTERDPDFYEGMFQSDGKTEVRPPKHRGRIVTTLHKAKEVRPLVERCITIAKKALPHVETAEEFATSEDRNSDGWNKWRKSEQWQKWAQARAPIVSARRRVFSMLRDKEAVEILFEEIAPRYMDRTGGYTRVMRLAKPRLGDAGIQAILELVGQHDKVKKAAAKPTFEADDVEETKVENEAPAEEEQEAEANAQDSSADEEE